MNEERVLVVDDDPLFQQLVRTTLEQAGYAVITASNGEEGLETIQGEHPDLVISDVMMPKVDGFELVRRLRADPLVGTTPLIILSAKGDEEDFVKGLELGADDYVAKPFRTKELTARVKSMLRRRAALLENRAPSVKGPFAEEGLEHLAALSFDNFVVGAGNRSAYEAALAASENPGSRFNPLFLYGGPGLGKTHLMCALSNAAFERLGAVKVLYRTSEVFSQQILDAYENRRVSQLKEEYLGLDILVIDDIQFLAISPSLQVVASEIFSEMYDRGKQMIISSDRRPEELQAITEEISSGFGIGLVVEVDRPDASLRAKILSFKAKQHAWPIPDDVLDYLANELSSDVRTLEGIAKRMVAMNTLGGVPLTRELVDDLIREISGSAESGVPVEHSDDSISRAFESYAERMEGAKDSEEKPVPTDPITEEFTAMLGVKRVFGEVEDVAASIPEADATPVVVLGSSRALVVDTIEALVGRADRSSGMPEGNRWAYMAHLDSKSPKHVLLGISRWEHENELAIAMQGLLYPVCLIVLDSKSPNVLDARRLISSVPEAWRKAVVVLVGVDTESLEGSGTALSKSLQRLFRIPDEIPMTVSGLITTAASRNWLGLLNPAPKTDKMSLEVGSKDEPSSDSGGDES